ncbi:MAG: Stk1 family PASTA domain-containing Ser/Thr kinase [Oscillospiraceae bacterium]|nr:Stk1 family PASTA domain-containing Ser/Thr kinase [Oscillospiraceae bacterium]
MEKDKYIGRLLDNRYEVLEVIGTGGMAVVYKARCHRLNRLVAIKILKDDNLEDEDFRRRFHAESQAVAMLSHPNIVSVYDVSTSIMADYIVMELIEGITLKQYMEKKGILNWKETLHFAIQIAKALEHAHGKGIVHRDIKPHNIMVLKNGSVKVMDFGIARMISRGNTLTKEALGSVHYISPEQAKGGRVDDRSDLYSLGVVMYEMMAGRPPYDGETPVAVAIKHINGGATMPSLLNPNIPGGLEQIIMKAMAHNVADRYPSATRMLSDMDEFRKDPTMLFDYNTPPLDAVTRMQKPPLVLQTPATTAQKVAENQALRTETPSIRAIQSQRRQEADRRRKQEMEEKRSRVTTIAIISCALVAVIAIVVFMVIFLGGGGLKPAEEFFDIPNFTNKLYTEVQNQEHPGVIIRKEESYHDTVEAGVIISQKPDAGTQVKKDGKNAVVVVTVSKGPKITMGNLEDQTEDKAKEWLDSLQLELDIEVELEFNDTVEAGKVIRTEPEQGAELLSGNTVILYVSNGEEIRQILMPDVVNQELEAAKKQLELLEMKLTIQIEEVYDAEVEAGRVIKTEPSKNETIKTRDTVILYVSKGPVITMEDLQGKTFLEATEWLNSLELELKVKQEEEFSNTVEKDYVCRTDPKKGEELKDGQTITLYMSKGAEKKVMPNVVGMDVGNAVTTIVGAGFKTPTIQQVDSQEPKDTVVTQSHEKGLEYEVTEEIVLEISKGAQPTEPPEVTKTVVIDLQNVATEADCQVQILRDGKEVYAGTVVKGTENIILQEQSGWGVVDYTIIVDSETRWTVREEFSANG